MGETVNNLRAFLDMIAFSEGTISIGDHGYNCLVGSTVSKPVLFGSYVDHPRIKVWLRKDDPSTPADESLVSTAAGRYQILARIFDAYKKQLALPDFSPASQDAIAVQLIRERDALADVSAGRFETAVNKVKNIWASLPAAGYQQHENSLANLRDAYVKAGGLLA
jgi:muramidase (phage lysozyme)